MKSRNIGKIILVYFLKTIGIIGLFIFIGWLSYYLTLLYYKKTDVSERCTTYTHVIPVNAGNESSNLIFSYNKHNKKVDAVVLELFDVQTKNLAYVTFPADTQISLSKSTFNEILEKNPSVPQVVTLRDIPTYFSGDVAYEYGIMILQDAIKVDIGYFTMVDSITFNKTFASISKAEKIFAPSAEVKKNLSNCTSQETMSDYFEEQWPNIVSDLALSQKQNYAGPLSQVKPQFIRAYGAKGTSNGSYFALDGKATKKLINSIWESGPYTSEQVVKAAGNEKASAVGKGIMIYNSTGVNGLAAGFQKKMEADGLTIMGVDNYVGQKLQITKIYAKKKKWGQALVGYFKKAEVAKKNELSSGADIEIVIGMSDASLN